MPATAPGPDCDLPVPLRVAAILAALESVSLAMLGALEVVSIQGSRIAMGATTALFFFVAAGGLGWCAWSLWLVRRWARGPVVMTQLIQLGLAWNLRAEPTRPMAVVLAVVAVVVIVALVHPASTEVLEEDARSGA